MPVEFDAEGSKAFSEFEIELVGKIADDARKQLGSIQNWILASCLSTNGGALILVNGDIKLSEETTRNCSLVFFLGVCSAIIFSMIYAQVQLKVLQNMHNLVIDMAGNSLTEEGFQEAGQKVVKWDTISDFLTYFQYLSVVFFIVGGVVAGLDLYGA